MAKWFGLILAIAALAVAIGWASLDKDTRNLLAAMPTDRDVLFWSTEQRDAAFRAMDALPVLAKARVIETGDEVYPLPHGEAIEIPTDVDAYMAEQRTSALVIVHDGSIVLEKYGLGFSGDGKWTSFSVAKSLTSTLVGAAVKDGYIKSLDDNVASYIEGLEGSEYENVSIRELLTMTSGVQWNEDYTDPQSDVALFNEHKADAGHGRHGKLHACPPARSAGGRKVGLQNRRDQSHRRAG